LNKDKRALEEKKKDAEEIKKELDVKNK